MRMARISVGGRFVALLLLCLISADAALDAACDPIVGPRDAAQTVSAAGSTGDEPCATSCLPDCFCCSRSLTAAAVVLPGSTGPIALRAEKAAPQVPQGVRPVPYHPPLYIS